MALSVRGLERAERNAARLAGRPLQRITQDAAERSIGIMYRYARRNNVGFVNRTGLLRSTLRIEQARTRRGRFHTGVQLVARTHYAGYVEWRRRTRDRRPRGPRGGYWFDFVRARVERRMTRQFGRLVARGIRREWVRR